MMETGPVFDQYNAKSKSLQFQSKICCKILNAQKGSVLSEEMLKKVQKLIAILINGI